MATFFFDNDISFRIARALAQLVHDHKIIALRDQFAVDTPDTEWIPEAGRNGWVVISRDFNQRRRDSEHEALRQHQVTALYIRQGSQPKALFADAARIISSWPKIQKWGIEAPAGTLARLDTTNQIHEL